MQESRQSNATIAIVDDDPSVREGLSSLIRSAGLQVETFASAQEFLARAGAEAPSYLVLDLQLPGLSGLDLQEVMQQVVSGLLNKQVAAELNITEYTVKIHRGRVMRKMHAESLADLVRMAESLGIHPAKRSDRT